MQYRPRNRRRSRRRVRWGRLIAVLAGLAVAGFGLVKLIGYGVDWMASRQTAQELRAVYYAEITPAPIAATAAPTEAPTSAPAPSAAPTSAPIPTQSPIPRLPAAGYPNNPKAEISGRFRHLRKESKYIVGWLTINRLLDEPVVQRDNVYFLDHDAKGKENVNGALFLDSGIPLKSRPYTYIIYGHNMKSGAMFGSLRNYENRAYYHNAPFITFDTMYEEGRYVIVAVGSVSTEEWGRNYVNFYALKSLDIAGRQKAIDALISASVHTCTIDVQPEDQLLVLVTCVDKDEERRVVAARRIRDGEDEKELKMQVERSRKR